MKQTKKKQFPFLNYWHKLTCQLVDVYTATDKNNYFNTTGGALLERKVTRPA
jgi:hypothetical protein